MSAKPASVAKIGRRTHKHAQAPQSSGRQLMHVYLKDLARAMVLVLSVVLVSAMAMGFMR